MVTEHTWEVVIAPHWSERQLGIGTCDLAEEVKVLKWSQSNFAVPWDEFITQLLSQQWVAVTRFLFPTESGHVATAPVCSREGESESAWEQRLGELSLRPIPPSFS